MTDIYPGSTAFTPSHRRVLVVVVFGDIATCRYFDDTSLVDINVRLLTPAASFATA